ncbi:hypothetical protein [Desulfocurvus vexinensis]|uniref:hypothetical protein n=1 Tax=Desulfocurvus vexinensis TaxID=399548 RepID=UPI0004B0FB83|nr:hypothetical protein [Desulfocurvus vexinensis]
MNQETTALARVVGALTQAAARIRELEREAEGLLHEQGDPQGAAAKLRRKAELLRDLPDELDGLLDGLDPQTRDRVERKADNLCARASAALGQGSVFWMRNLLYPEDYREGEPNELERFITSLGR